MNAQKAPLKFERGDRVRIKGEPLHYIIAVVSYDNQAGTMKAQCATIGSGLMRIVELDQLELDV